MKPQRIVFLTLLLLSFGVSPAFSVDCSNYNASVTYFATYAEADAAYQQRVYYYGAVGKVSSGDWINTCYGVEVGLQYYERYEFVGSVRNSALYVVDPDYTPPDRDGDGIPDDDDSCPDNPDPNCTDPGDGGPGDGDGDGDPPPPDSDGDGTPDDSDPCPYDPSPDCQGSGTPPDSVDVGECSVNLVDLKAWLVTEGSFPFNFVYALYNGYQFVFEDASSEESLILTYPLALGEYLPWDVPDSVDIVVDLTPFTNIALIVKLSLTGLSMWAFSLYGIRRLRNFTGIS